MEMGVVKFCASRVWNQSCSAGVPAMTADSYFLSQSCNQILLHRWLKHGYFKTTIREIMIEPPIDLILQSAIVFYWGKSPWAWTTGNYHSLVVSSCEFVNFLEICDGFLFLQTYQHKRECCHQYSIGSGVSRLLVWAVVSLQWGRIINMLPFSMRWFFLRSEWGVSHISLNKVAFYENMGKRVRRLLRDFVVIQYCLAGVPATGGKPPR